MFLDLSSCGPAFLLKILYFAKLLIFDILFNLIPIVLIVIIIIDFSKAVVSGEDDILKKTFVKTFKRIMYAIIIFIIPYIIGIVNNVLWKLDVDYNSCFMDLNLDAINNYEQEEIALENGKKEEERLKLEAKKKKKEEIEKQKEELENNSNVPSSPSTPNHKPSKPSPGINLNKPGQNFNKEACDGAVYYENGVYYKPDFRTSIKGGKPETKGSAEAGYNKFFYQQVQNLIEAGKKAGQNFYMSPNEGDGAWRTYENQLYYWNLYGQDPNKAAPPGSSNHGYGLASDMKGSDSALAWAKSHAREYGLHFPVNGEAWHIEPLVIQKNNEVTDKCWK